VVAAGTLLVDQISKSVARGSLEIGRPVDVLPGFFSFKLTENPGAAFGALGAWPAFLVVIGLVAVLAIVGLRKERSKSYALAASLGLLLGGTVGNLVDRIRFGWVTDFLDLHITARGRELSWPTFNLADVAITVGAILLVYHLLFVERQENAGRGVRNAQ